MGNSPTIFEIPLGFKRFTAFGALFFAAGFVGSIVLIFLPSFNQHAAMRWVWPICSVGYAAFAMLCISVLRMLDDTVEVSHKGITAHRRHKPDVELAWEKIVEVDNCLQARCFKLRAADGRMIRIEYQVENLPALLTLLERNIPLPESRDTTVVFKRVVIEPHRVIFKRLFRPHVIEMKDIRDVRMKFRNDVLYVLIHERGRDNPVMITGNRKTFQLVQLLRHRLELSL